MDGAAAIGSADSRVTTIKIMFKSATGPPTKRRGAADYLNDVGRGLSYSVSHVELLFPDKTAFLATVDRGVRPRPNSRYDRFDAEGAWQCFEFYVRALEANTVRAYCERKTGHPYDLWGLLCGMVACCPRMRRVSTAKFTCTSLCFQALMQSQTFRHSLRKVDPNFWSAETGNPAGRADYDSHPQRLYDLLLLMSVAPETRSTIARVAVPVKIGCTTEQARREMVDDILFGASTDSDRESDSDASDDPVEELFTH